MEIFAADHHDREVFLTNSFGDRYLFSVNHNTLNQLGAVHVHQERFRDHLQKKNTLFIVLGTDSGTLLPFLLANPAAQGSSLVLIEPDEIFENIQKQYAAINLPGNILYGPAKDFDQLVVTAGIERYFYAGEVQVAKSLAAEYGFLGEYHDLSFDIQNRCQQREWQVRLKIKTQPFTHAQLDNVADNVIASTFLTGAFQGRTALLLAGGPSLDAVLPWAMDHRDELVILAVSRICRRLLEVGLTPDFIFSIDPHRVSYEVSVEMLHFWSDATLIHSNHINPLLLGQWRGRSIYLSDRLPWKSAMNKPSLPMAGPTVANTALSVAVAMGFSRILLAGMDLCRSREGYTHAAGSNERLAGPQLAAACTQVATYGGWMAETSSDFLAAISILSVQAEQARQHDVILINLAECAARVEGVAHVPMDAIDLPGGPPNTSQVVEHLFPRLTRADRIADLQQVLDELVQAKGQLLHIKKLTKEALQCNKGLFGRDGKQADFKHKLRMDKIERKLNGKHADMSTFVKKYAAHQLLKMTILGKDDSEWTDSEIEQSAETYYSNYHNNASALLKRIDALKEKIQLRLREEEPGYALLPTLIPQWIKDEQPGRVFLWMDRQQLSEDDLESSQEAFTLIRDRYERQFHLGADSLHLKRSRLFSSLRGLVGKMLLYAKRQDLEYLQQLSHSLEEHPDPEAIKYFLLCSGLVAELESSPDQALECYQRLFDHQDDIFLEHALQRIAALSVARRDDDNSLLALELLANFSPTYLVQYGDLLRLLGRSQDALNTYLTYLEKAPGDAAMMLKTGNYFREVNIPQGALEMYRHVLQLDPENQTARQLLESLEAATSQ